MIVAGLVTWQLLYLNVCKQNVGILSAGRVLRWRASVLFGQWLVHSSIVGVFAIALWAVASTVQPTAFVNFVGSGGNPLSNLIVPFVSWSNWSPGALEGLTRYAALVLSANAIGTLVQWNWEDRSALEPL